MKTSIYFSWIVACLVFLLGCKEDNWAFIRSGYSYKITSKQKDKDDIFHITKATYVFHNIFGVPVAKDSINFLADMLLASDDIKKWQTNLPKDVSGSLKVDLDSFYTNTFTFLPITIFLLEKHSNSDLRNDSNWLKKQPLYNSFQYISKDEALLNWKKNGGEDMTMFTDGNILPESFELNIPLDKDFYNIDSIEQSLKINLKTFSSTAYPKAMYNTRKSFKNLSLQLDFQN